MYDDLTYAINGCLFNVYNTLGNIWKEEVYEKAFVLELHAQGIHAEAQKEFEVFYFDKRVGQYRVDVLAGEQVIVELKAVPEIFPLHQAQVISYLKGYDKPVGILANFGGKSLQHQTFPNRVSQKNPVEDRFDFDKLTLKGKEKIRDLLFMANRVFITLGAGYFHQIYRRAMYHELTTANIPISVIKEVTAHYQHQVVGARDVNFFQIGDLLLSAVAVNELNQLVLLKFRNYIKHLHCQRGLIVNFNATVLDFRYIEI